MNCEYYREPLHKSGNKQRAFCVKKKFYTDPAICRFCGLKATKKINENEEEKKNDEIL